MRKSRRKRPFLDTVPKFYVFTITLLCVELCACVNEYHYQYITDDSQFGCRWAGGTMATATCQCREDAGEMFIQRNSIPSFDTSAIIIRNCPIVKIAENAISDMRNLRRVELENINSIFLEEKSLNWYGYRDVPVGNDERFDVSVPSVKIHIRNSIASNISSQSFSGRINEILFENVRIENVEPFAFSNLLQTEKVVLNQVDIRNAKLQCFKRFGTEFLELNNVRAELVPSRTFSNVTVYNQFKISNSTFGTVRPGAFTIYNPEYFEVINTNITQLDGEAFTVTTRGDVLFKNNNFHNVNDGAFSAIRLNRQDTVRDHTVTFDSNIFSMLTRDSLSIKDFTPVFVNLNLNITCDCTDINHNIKDAKFYSEIQCLYNEEYTTIREFRATQCSVVSNYFTVIVIVCVVILLGGLIGIALYVYYVKVYRCKKYGSTKQGKANNNLSLIVPDGRTYRETELHVIVEKADLLTTDL